MLRCLKHQLGLMLMLVVLAGCSKEARTLTADQPQTPPRGADDPRAAKYQDNVYQVAQGGRYFTWYGCGSCHAAGATGVLDLGDAQWRHGGGFDQTFGFIAHGHAGELGQYANRIPVEQLWQITAYVRELGTIAPEQRRRQDRDEQAEPQGRTWWGPQR